MSLTSGLPVSRPVPVQQAADVGQRLVRPHGVVNCRAR
jgi:hypothetical protein